MPVACMCYSIRTWFL